MKKHLKKRVEGLLERNPILRRLLDGMIDGAAYPRIDALLLEEAKRTLRHDPEDGGAIVVLDKAEAHYKAEALRCEYSGSPEAAEYWTQQRHALRETREWVIGIGRAHVAKTPDWAKLED